MKNWIKLIGDVDWETYGGAWARKDKFGIWWVIHFENMYESQGLEICKHYNFHKFTFQVRRLNLKDLSTKEIARALACCGMKMIDGALIGNDGDGEEIQDQYVEIATVEACVVYGLGILEREIAGSVYALRLRAQARRYAENMMR